MCLPLQLMSRKSTQRTKVPSVDAFRELIDNDEYWNPAQIYHAQRYSLLCYLVRRMTMGHSGVGGSTNFLCFETLQTCTARSIDKPFVAQKSWDRELISDLIMMPSGMTICMAKSIWGSTRFRSHDFDNEQGERRTFFGFQSELISTSMGY